MFSFSFFISFSQGLGPESVFSDQIELETLLAKKIQSLETDLTDARKTILELKSQESDLRSQVHSLKNSLETSSQLIKRLVYLSLIFQPF